MKCFTLVNCLDHCLCQKYKSRCTNLLFTTYNLIELQFRRTDPSIIPGNYIHSRIQRIHFLVWVSEAIKAAENYRVRIQYRCSFFSFSDLDLCSVQTEHTKYCGVQQTVAGELSVVLEICICLPICSSSLASHKE